MSPEVQQAIMNLFMAFIIFLVAAGIALVLLFVLVLTRRWVKNGIDLYPVDRPLPLDGLEHFFSSIRLDEYSNVIMFTQSSRFRRCVVSIVYSVAGKKTWERYVLSFSDSEKTCGIKLGVVGEKHVDSLAVYIDSVDKRINKHPLFDNTWIITLIPSSVAGILYGIAVICYVYMDSYYLVNTWPFYGVYYLFATVGLLLPLISVGGYFLGDYFDKK